MKIDFKLPSRRELKEQRMMQMLIDLEEMGQDLCNSIKNAHWKNVKRFKTPTDHMQRAVDKWEEFWRKAREGNRNGKVGKTTESCDRTFKIHKRR